MKYYLLIVSLISSFCFAESSSISCSSGNQDNGGSISFSKNNTEIDSFSFDWFTRGSPEGAGYSCSFWSSIHPEKNEFIKSKWAKNGNTIKITLDDDGEYLDGNFITITFNDGIYTVNLEHAKLSCDVDRPEIIKLKIGSDKCLN